MSQWDGHHTGISVTQYHSLTGTIDFLIEFWYCFTYVTGASTMCTTETELLWYQYAKQIYHGTFIYTIFMLESHLEYM